MSSPVSTRRPAKITCPSSSAIMSKIYDNIEKVERSALRLCSDLRRQMDGKKCLLVSCLSLTLAHSASLGGLTAGSSAIRAYLAHWLEKDAFPYHANRLKRAGGQGYDHACQEDCFCALLLA